MLSPALPHVPTVTWYDSTSSYLHRFVGGRASRSSRRRPAAPAFTLTELLIVVAVLALVLSLSLPSLRRLSSKSELQNAARQLRANLLQSRLTAIESGSVTYFRYQPGGGSFEAASGARRPARSDAAERPSSAEPQPPDSDVAAPDEATPLQLLPLGVRFAEPSTHQPLRPPVAAAGFRAMQLGQRRSSFTPTAERETRIALVNEAYRIELNVRGLTGTVQISQVERLVSVEVGPSDSDRGGRAMSRSPRPGFSLLEVMLATGILLACLIVLGELASVGRRHARDAEQLTAAQLLCRTRLNEMLAGAAPLESQAASEVPGLSGWSWRVQVEPLERYGLTSVTVTLARVAPATLDAPAGSNGKTFSLTRWVHSSDRTLAGAGGHER